LHQKRVCVRVRVLSCCVWVQRSEKTEDVLHTHQLSEFNSSEFGWVSLA
jgi:hypothetical protein